MNSQKRILICDDEEALADEVAEAFAFYGWDAQAAYGYFEAAQMLETASPFSCLLTDRAMPLRDGDQLIAFASSLPVRRRPRVVAVMTGVDGIDSPYDFRAHFTVAKPFDIAALCDRFARELETTP